MSQMTQDIESKKKEKKKKQKERQDGESEKEKETKLKKKAQKKVRLEVESWRDLHRYSMTPTLSSLGIFISLCHQTSL